MSELLPNSPGSNAYQAIARRFRPTRFEDLVGQGHVVKTLKNAIAKSRVAHAYLFSGARGIGKTSVARIFAKALRCPNAVDAVPCNECPECQAIAESRSVDVVEIDGASNNGVEAVRGIRENVVYGASSGTYKIYIIDEVHMLSISAFNALLKTLEEPPPSVVFIFATTEVQKIPLTILSRCQRFEFRRLTNTQIAERLKQILESEKNQLSEEALRTIASHADGSLRDALSLLEQVLSYFGNTTTETITEIQVSEALGISESSQVRDLLTHTIKKEIPAALKIVNESYLAGVDLKHFTERCLEELRLLYLVKLSDEDPKQGNEKLTNESLDISASHFQQLQEQVERASLLQLERMAQILSKCISQLGWVSSPRFLLEMAVVRMANLDGLSHLEKAFIEGGKRENRKAAEPAPDQYEEPEGAAVGGPPSPKPNPYPTKPSPKPAPPRQEEPPLPPPPPEEMMDGPGQSTMENRGEVRAASGGTSWKGFVDHVMKKRPLLGALLSHANFNMENGPTGKIVHMAFAPGSFYEKQSEDQKNRAEILEHVRAFFGPATQLKQTNDMVTTSISLEESKRQEINQVKQEALAHPMVQKMKDVLGAEVVDVNVEQQ